MGTKLSVNLNKVAKLRNTRGVGIPDVTYCARLCLDAGANGLTVHPRPDQRHIRPGDVYDLAALLADFPHAEFNIEGNPFHGLVDYVDHVRPTQCTLVPDETTQATSDHGWDLRTDAERLRPIVARIKATGCRVSLFVEPDAETVGRAADLGVDRVELYTESFASAFSRGDHGPTLARFRDAAAAAKVAGVGVNAGHDLSIQNLGPFLAGVPDVLEVSIGHALVSDALELGLAETVRRYQAVLTASMSRTASSNARG